MNQKKVKALSFVHENKKYFHSKDYNYIFDMKSGEFMRWGSSYEKDPLYSSFGPEILDIEVSTICNGIPRKIKSKSEYRRIDAQNEKNGGVEEFLKPHPCKHCYKSNTAVGKNMSFETFKTIFDKMPKTLTQIAFGIGDINANEDFWKMVKFSRDNGIIPNYTTNGYFENDGYAEFAINETARNCGAVAVSAYSQNKDICYNAVKRFTDVRQRFVKKDAPLKGLHTHNLVFSEAYDRNPLQVNIHCLLSAETLDFCYEVCNDKITDPRLKDLNAIVFLFLKQKGRGSAFHNVTPDQYKKFINFMLEKNIPFGHDSCCYPNFISAVDKKHLEQMRVMCEACESSLFSSYVNVEGKYFPCSFAEEKFEGIDVVNCEDFIRDVWMNGNTSEFRDKLINSTHSCNCVESEHGCRACPIYPTTICEKYVKE